jgi:hypothetical protein
MCDEISDDDRAQARVFGQAYAEWAEATAAIAKIEGFGSESDEQSDEQMNAAIERLAVAERRLTTTPAALGHQLVTKFEILECMLSERERDGPPNDNRHMLMLAAVKADFYHFEMTHRP